MRWLTENWFWVLIFVAFIAMHVSGHGCHSGHGSHSDELRDGDRDVSRGGDTSTRNGTPGSRAHEH